VWAQLDEVVRLPGAVPSTLIGWVVVDRLTRVMGDVHHPVGHAGQLFGDARPALEVDAAHLRLVVGGHRLGDRPIPLRLTCTTPTSGRNQDNDEGK
jgi:hypothetical protein